MNQVNYLHVMTPEEVEIYHGQIDFWWNSLSWAMKGVLMSSAIQQNAQQEYDSKEAVRKDMARIMDEKMGREEENLRPGSQINEELSEAIRKRSRPGYLGVDLENYPLAEPGYHSSTPTEGRDEHMPIPREAITPSDSVTTTNAPQHESIDMWAGRDPRYDGPRDTSSYGQDKREEE